MDQVVNNASSEYINKTKYNLKYGHSIMQVACR